MTTNNKSVAALTIKFLADVLENREVSEDYADSLNVAIDCLTEAFEVEREDVTKIVDEEFAGEDLKSLVSKARTKNQGGIENVEVNIPVEDAEIKAKAEALKLEGNKLMANKDFEGAIEQYSRAISVLPTNAIYYANRAAAYSSKKDYTRAIEDAESAIRIDPSYSKGYSRLGFAKYAQGDAEEALEAYKRVMELEGDKATDIMKRDYEMAKKKVEESMNLEKSASGSDSNENGNASAPSGTGGFPDLSSLLGGGLSGIMNNPQVMEMAQKMMSDPQSMQKMQGLMQNPALKQMAQSFQSGNAPDFSSMMNDPSIRDLASKFGGAGGNSDGDSTA